MPGESSEDELRIAIMRLSRRMRLERVATDITDGQLSVLFVLMQEGAQTLSSLSEQEKVSAPSMNRTVNSLVRAQLVTRGRSTEDGRKVTIEPTDAGLELVKETRRRRVAWFARQLAQLTAEQRAVVSAATPLLRQVADS